MFNKELLLQYKEEKKLIINKHPSADLYIYNYTPTVQFSKQWDDVTKQCRGLILNANGDVIARPFPKFFNLSEHREDDIPTTSFTRMEKLDGSLGIVYKLNHKLYIATRGSFNSDQSVIATKLLHTQYAHLHRKLDFYVRNGITPLFEIIYPENQIVVNYGGGQQLVLIALIDNKTGRDFLLSEINDVKNYFSVPKIEHFDKSLPIADLLSWTKLNPPNQEGYVLYYPNDFRVKVKFEEYCRLHKIMTGFSEKRVWEYLSTAQDIDALINATPDEFYQEVQTTVRSFKDKYAQVELISKEKFESIVEEGADEIARKKSFALQALQFRYPSVLFRMREKKPYEHIIWNIIQPS